MQNSECAGQKAAALTAVLTKSKNEQQRQQAKERLVTLAKETHDMSSAALAACMLASDGSWQDAVAMTQAHPTMEMQAMHVFFLLMFTKTSGSLGASASARCKSSSASVNMPRCMLATALQVSNKAEP
mmetsp:Transcript_11369/g.16129  ORF Transcript_11369/g.16129 Transcript_11369/m.16129 type:complete len:128 (+) Transcript_11369:1-384(+)